MIRLADYLVDFLVKNRVNDIFLVSGGGIMYLLDAVAKNKRMRYFANHHEQACATAAEAHARVKNRPSACLVTSGPGGANAITGVAAAWFDSIPLLVISGQVKREIIADYAKIRQMAPQEINIVTMVKPITKYAYTIMKPAEIRYHLEKAFYLTTEGRPGPVWLDIPLDVQGSLINEVKLVSFLPQSPKSPQNPQLKKSVSQVIKLLKKSQRPVLITGNGIRLSGGESSLKKVVNKLKIPLLTTVNGIDLVAENNPYFIGRFGPSGQRRANLTLQNADLVLAIGASLNVASTGFNYRGFAPKAKKIMVNIDRAELIKHTLAIDLPIEADAKAFMDEFLIQAKNLHFRFHPRWLKVCRDWKRNYSLIISDFFKDKKHVNSYVFFDRLANLLTSRDTVVTGMGLDTISCIQAFKVKNNQRNFVNKNFGQMGWCLPAAIGACVASNKRVICVTGDGSIQMNSQELETIRYYQLPIKIFVFNNRGYKTIRDTQNNLCEGRLVGADEKSGVSNPDFKLLAYAHGLSYQRIDNNNQLVKKIKRVLGVLGPVLCEVNIAYDQPRIPRIITYRREDGSLASRPLEDMFPLLPREELRKNMSLFDKK